jgi:hypothetical protein
MRIEEQHYDFKIKKDKVDSLQKRNFNPAQIDWLLNEAIWVWLKTNYGLSNKFQTGFEGTEHRIQDLKNLHIKSPNPQPAVVPALMVTGEYELDLKDLEYEHLFSTRVRAKITKDNCTKVVGVTVTQTDDLNETLYDPFNKPSFSYNRIIGVYGRATDTTGTIINPYGLGSLYLYTDGTFTIDEVYIDYIKYPNRVWIGSYDLTSDLRPKNANNTYIYQTSVDNPVHCDINSHAHNEIVDIAVNLAAMMVEDPNMVQLSALKIQTNK